MADSSRPLTVNMHARAYERLWPKADIRTESKSVFLSVRFGGKNGHSDPKLGGVISIVGVVSVQTDKAKPAERRERKATGPRFLRDVSRHEGP